MRALDTFILRPLTTQDHDLIARFVEDQWGGPVMVAHGVLYDLTALPAFLVLSQDTLVGLLTYHIQDNACEIVSLDSVQENRGIGTALVEAVKGLARQQGCTHLGLITTNDNLHALRFYQKRGFLLSAFYRDAVAAARKLKPQIPVLGNDDIPIRDEIGLELPLESMQ